MAAEASSKTDGGRAFLRLWTAQAVSSLGARIAREGLPMAAVITLKAGPEAVGLLAAATLGAQGLVGPFAGALADLAPKKALMVAADLVRALVLALVPAAAFAHRLSFAEILGAGVLMGAGNVLFDVADHALLPSLVPAAKLVFANARLATTESVAEVAGPAVAGGLFQLAGPAPALAVNAATYLASALILFGLRAPAPAAPGPAAPTRPAQVRLDLAAGLRATLSEPRIRPLWLADVTRALFGGFFGALYILYAIRILHLGTALLGLTIAAGGVGGLVGATMTGRLERRLGLRRAIAVTALGSGAISFMIPLANGAPLVAMGTLVAAQFGGDALAVAMEISAVSLRQTLIPADRLGGAAGAFRSGAALAGVAGALIGGALGHLIGVRPTLVIAAAGMTSASLFLVFSNPRRAEAQFIR